MVGLATKAQSSCPLLVPQGHEADEMKMLGEGVKKADEYWQLMYSASGGLVSKNSTFSKAKSICEDDDD